MIVENKTYSVKFDFDKCTKLEIELLNRQIYSIFEFFSNDVNIITHFLKNSLDNEKKNKFKSALEETAKEMSPEEIKKMIVPENELKAVLEEMGVQNLENVETRLHLKSAGF